MRKVRLYIIYIKLLIEEVEVLTYESKEVEETIETIAEYIKEKGDELKISDLKDEIRNQCVSIGAEKDLKYYITFNSLFTVKILEEFKKYKGLLKTMLAQEGEEGVKSFIMAMVNFFITKNPQLGIAIPSFLKFVYDSDLIDEEILLKWEGKKFKTNKKSSLYNKKSEKKFKKKGEKFFTWLKEAEEDESEESEEDEEKKVELTEEQIKEQKMRELIHKEKEKQEKELAESKAKEKDTEEQVNKDADGKIDVLAVEVDAKDVDDIDFDDI